MWVAEIERETIAQNVIMPQIRRLLPMRVAEIERKKKRMKQIAKQKMIGGKI